MTKKKRRLTKQQRIDELAGGPEMVEFTGLQFSLLVKASELYEKKAATTATALVELGVPGLFLASRRALVAAGVTALSNRDESEVLGPAVMTPRQREASRWAVLFYRGELEKLMKKEAGFLVDTDDTEEKIAHLDAILSLLGDQLQLGAPVEMFAEQKEDGQTLISINGGEQISIHDIDRLTQELKKALEGDDEPEDEEGKEDWEK